MFHRVIYFFCKIYKIISYEFFVLIKKIFHFGASFVLFCLKRVSQVIKALSSIELRLTPVQGSFQFVVPVHFLGLEEFGGGLSFQF